MANKKKQKIIVIGTNHAGTLCIRTLATLSKDVEVVTYDRNDNISFLGCGIALWVGGEFSDPSGLFYSSPQQLRAMGIQVNMMHEVIAVDPKTKTVTVKDLKTNKVMKDKYDKLVCATGTWPIVPPIPGVDFNNIYLSKLYQHAQKIKQAAMDPKIKNVVVVGAGYIGVELVEAFDKYKKNVTLIDMVDRVIPKYFDPEFTTEMENRMKKGINKNGVKLALGEKIVKFTGDKKGNVTSVVTDKGTYKADLVILSIGIKPQTDLLKPFVKTIPNGAIIVNPYQQTSCKDIYAIGDCSAVHHNVFKDNQNVALATNAIKTGFVAAMHILRGEKFPLPGVEGTNAISVYGCNYASTGLSEESLKALKMDYKSEYFEDNDRPEFMHSVSKVKIKITYDPKTHKLLGAQIGSYDGANHTEVIYALSLAIQKGMTLVEVALIDYFFLPHFNKPFNYIIIVCLNALGLKYPLSLQKR